MRLHLCRILRCEFERRRNRQRDHRSRGLCHRIFRRARIPRLAPRPILGQRNDGRPHRSRRHLPPIWRVQFDAGLPQRRIVAKRLEHQRSGHLHGNGDLCRTDSRRRRLDHHHHEFMGFFQRCLLRNDPDLRRLVRRTAERSRMHRCGSL